MVFRSHTCYKALCPINGIYDPQIFGVITFCRLPARLNAALFAKDVMRWKALMDYGFHCGLRLPVGLCDRACVCL